jgi:hypothetical protein
VNVGDVVLVRNVFGGRVRGVFPSRYVGRWGSRHGLYCQPGTHCKRSKSADDQSYAQQLAADGPAYDFEWKRTLRGRPAGKTGGRHRNGGHSRCTPVGT